ncbi:hypothetical protein Ancab_018061 [Ancistrocladus abbreviatus]
MAKQSGASFVSNQQEQQLVLQDDLCNWEFINHELLQDDDDDYDAIFAEVQSLDSFSSSNHEEEEEGETQQQSDIIDLNPHDVAHEFPPKHQNQLVDGVNFSGSFDVGQNHDVGSHVDLLGYYGDYGHHYEIGYYDHGVNDVDDYGSDDGYDLDDELVPWEVADRLGRQRLRKLGKRAFAKMTKSKKMAHIYIKPGCVRGKHGLGLKAY